MIGYGSLHKSNGRYLLRFERFSPKSPEDVFSSLTNPTNFSKWYPFASGEMDLKVGGEIAMDDGEGSVYSARITDLKPPHLFAFREMDDLLSISLEEDKGCRIIFTHTFDEGDWAASTAAGWHRCLDVLLQIIDGEDIHWEDNATELREYYSGKFNSQL